MRSFFSRVCRLALVGVDPIEDLAGGNRAPAGGAAGGERTCEFCACRLTSGGEVLQMSDKARALRTLEDRLAREQEDHARTKGELTAALAQVSELKAQLNPAPPKKNWGPT